MKYAELQVTSNYSFLRGASDPGEMVMAAAALGLKAIAITDRNSLAGVVRAHATAKQTGLRLVVGTRLDLADGASLLCYPTDLAAYSRLTRLLTLGKRRAAKGECHLTRADVAAHADGQTLIALPPDAPGPEFAAQLREWGELCPRRVFLAAQWRFRGDDLRRVAMLAELARDTGTPLVATNDVHYHVPERRPLQDMLTCIREGCTLAEAGWRLEANAERHLKRPEEMARLFAGYPDAVARSVDIAARCRFSLDELRYSYPAEDAGDGLTAQQRLEKLTWDGAARRYPDGIPPKVRDTVADELALIGRKDYAPYFLTVHDIVRFADSRGILCQGRGSAANSAVCFCLFITHVDPARFQLLFARFVSEARNEPPDIDVDFEHERREEVMQHIYAHYGRDHAGLTATVIHYRARSAIRDVGKVLGLSEDVVGALARTTWGWSGTPIADGHVRQVGLDPTDSTLALAMRLAGELTGFPRHLSQHVGGFVISHGRLDDLVPIENAAMADRTVIEWDKDDIDALGIMKVDVLALGMLSCIRRAFALLRDHHGLDLSLATVPPEDKAVYEMLGRADSVGVFQVESRAQMTMLPRLRPKTFYDLVIEVAIVRPGPIQGDMVHPYLRRREGKETVDYPSPELREVLERTLGVPLFQEQVMQIAIVAAGFTPDEADQLRRSMAAFRRSGRVAEFQHKLVSGMVAKGYAADFAERVFKQIEGFAEYGFPESHAAAFAQLVYVSAWIKCHYPAVFACALLNSQPMGFYAPAQIVRDAQDHGVRVLPADVNHSEWDCTLEPSPSGGLALRLGLRQIGGLTQADCGRLADKRGDGYASPHSLWRRAGLDHKALEALARADAFGSLGLARREALWAVKALTAAPPPLLAGLDAAEPPVPLPKASAGEEVVCDYASLKLSLKAHPMALLRPQLTIMGIVPTERLAQVQGRVSVAGLVLMRQRPGTASGVIFVTLEDETGIANLVVWPQVFERFRQMVLTSSCLKVDGRVQREGRVIHVIADRLTDLTASLRSLGDGEMKLRSRDFY
ncbi:Error-prone DNA polymerase dnaE [Magnetospirillum sp. XM-1]|uniref:error-prone DNA polymerase n=1 Tax=Magnetospirillum sp. XM-1 TaxID=1663591 RepID=UPI00073DD9FB|nr:error-prone DNA polymerase [Magnetospirillum sp. XM-1]CUW41627.1 Error-prone DNA polymerase dnaE [Magnetospirillum sp. XM-1]